MAWQYWKIEKQFYVAQLHCMDLRYCVRNGITTSTLNEKRRIRKSLIYTRLTSVSLPSSFLSMINSQRQIQTFKATIPNDQDPRHSLLQFKYLIKAQEIHEIVLVYFLPKGKHEYHIINRTIFYDFLVLHTMSTD